MCFKKPEFDADFKTAKSSDANASERKVKEVRFLTFTAVDKSLRPVSFFVINYCKLVTCKFIPKNEKNLLKKFHLIKLFIYIWVCKYFQENI
jgi:hypothetical protein